MLNNNPYEAYKDKEIQLSSPYELVGKLCGTAAICLKKAIVAIQNKKLDQASGNLIRAQEIVSALDGSLDMQYEISKQLRQIYQYMSRRLVEANVKKDTKILEEISEMLFGFRDTWDEALKRFKMSQSK